MASDLIERNRAIAGRFVDFLLHGGDPNTLFPPNFVYYDSQGNPNDLAATMGRIAPILTAIPDRSIHVEDQIVTENRVVLRWRRTGTFQSDAWGLHATGNHISDVGATILGIDSNGMISEAWEFWDVFNFFNQMGVIRAYVDIAAPQQPPAAGSASR